MKNLLNQSFVVGHGLPLSLIKNQIPCGVIKKDITVKVVAVDEYGNLTLNVEDINIVSTNKRHHGSIRPIPLYVVGKDFNDHLK